MITIRRARPSDAVAIGAVHVAAWRSTYPGILPDRFLSRLSVPRQAAYYEHAIRGGIGVHVAVATGVDIPLGSNPRIIGFATDGRARGSQVGERKLGDGEIETLYVLDDWRDRGIGRGLMREAAGHLAQAGCRSAYLWVLSENQSRWFYQRLGGRPAATGIAHVGGQNVAQTAYTWDPIEKLIQASAQAG
ncbi:MAG: GNAT family N-acetyltransferase [Acetobacteraceae bacterium]|nr:GNAT family N-acetyltransferase [Acetobacteraceae bacterium]